MQARFYIPWVGRFSSPDPARDQHFEFTQSWNIASYVRNNPVMSTDPTGMETRDMEGVVHPDEPPAPTGTPGANANSVRTLDGGTENWINQQTRAIATRLEEFTIKSSTLAAARDFLRSTGDGDLTLRVINDPNSNLIASYDNNDWSLTVNAAKVIRSGVVNDSILADAVGHEYRHAQADGLSMLSASRSVDLRNSSGALLNGGNTNGAECGRLRSEAARDGARANDINLSTNERNNALQRYQNNPIEIDARLAGARVAREVLNAN